MSKNDCCITVETERAIGEAPCVTGNAVGLTEQELAALALVDRAEARNTACAALQGSGAHFVVDSLRDASL